MFKKLSLGVKHPDCRREYEYRFRNTHGSAAAAHEVENDVYGMGTTSRPHGRPVMPFECPDMTSDERGGAPDKVPSEIPMTNDQGLVADELELVVYRDTRPLML